MRKVSHRRKLYGFRRNRPDPAIYAAELIKQHTAPEAFKMASRALDSVKKGMAGHLMEFCSVKELKRNEGFWMSVTGYVKKRIS